MTVEEGDDIAEDAIDKHPVDSEHENEDDGSEEEPENLSDTGSGDSESGKDSDYVVERSDGSDDDDDDDDDEQYKRKSGKHASLHVPAKRKAGLHSTFLAF